MSAADDTPELDRPRPRSLSDLFLSFSWLALQGFGGVLAVAQRELVEKKRWLTREEFTEEWAVAQIMPGPNVINMAIMLGGRHFGWRGGVVALAGMLGVPFVITLSLAMLYGQFHHYPAVAGALRGMGAVSAGLILATGLKMLTALRHNPMGRLSCLLLLAATLVAVVVLRWPLALTLLCLAPLATVWAWYGLGQQEPS